MEVPGCLALGLVGRRGDCVCCRYLYLMDDCCAPITVGVKHAVWAVSVACGGGGGACTEFRYGINSMEWVGR